MSHANGIDIGLPLHFLELHGKLLLEVPWPGQDLVLQGLTNYRLLLASEEANHFLSLTAGQEVVSYSSWQLGQGDGWAEVMDTSPSLRHLALYTPNLTAFQLYGQGILLISSATKFDFTIHIYCIPFAFVEADANQFYS